MRKPLERLREKICEERGHNLSERRVKEIEGMILAECVCLRCGGHYQGTPTALEMEKYYDDTRKLFV